MIPRPAARLVAEAEVAASGSAPLGAMSASSDIETEIPSFTSAAACLRLAGVIRLTVPGLIVLAPAAPVGKLRHPAVDIVFGQVARILSQPPRGHVPTSAAARQPRPYTKARPGSELEIVRIAHYKGPPAWSSCRARHGRYG